MAGGKLDDGSWRDGAFHVQVQLRFRKRGQRGEQRIR